MFPVWGDNKKNEGNGKENVIVVWYIWSCSWKYFFWEIKHKFWEIFRGQAPLSIYTSKQINRWYIDFSVPKTKTWKREVTPRPLKDGLWVPPPPKTKCCSANVSWRFQQKKPQNLLWTRSSLVFVLFICIYIQFCMILYIASLCRQKSRQRSPLT